MDKVTRRTIIENNLASRSGDAFQNLCNRLCLILHPDDYTPVRAGGPHGDTKNDGYCPRVRIFFAAHATRGEKTAATKKKIKDDLEGCLVQHKDVRKWVYLTNDTLLGEVQQFVDELRRQHPKVTIETWGHEKITNIIMSLDLSNISDVIGFDLGATVELTAEIDNAAQMLKEQKYLESLALLGRLWSQHNDSMSARQKYRTKANIGHAYEGLGKWEDAADHFLQAKQYDPEYEAARAREAIAYLHLGIPKKAHELSEALLKDFPEEKLGIAVLVRSAPKALDFDKLEKMVPEHQRRTPEIAMALGEAAIYRGCYETAEGYIGQVLKKTPDNPQIKETLGDLMLQRGKFYEQALYDRGPTKEELECIERARLLFTEALMAYEMQNHRDSIVRVRLKRADAHMGLDNIEALEEDVTFAYNLDRSDPKAAHKYASLKAKVGDFDTAISLLEEFLGKDFLPGLEFSLATCLGNRNRKGDKEHAIALLRSRLEDLGQTDPATRAEYVATLVQLERQARGGESALTILDTLPKDVLSTESLMVLRAKVLRLDGDQAKATNIAKDALAKIGPGTTVQDKRGIATLLQALGIYPEALKLWKSIVEPEYIGRDTQLLMECAYHCDDIKLAIEFSERLRANGLWARKAFDLEIDYREKYNDDEGAKQVMLDFLADPPDESYSPYVRVRLSLLGIRTDQKDLIERDPSKLPLVREVDPHVGILVIRVLRYGDEPLRAVEYAYNLLRLNWNQAEAHVALFQTLLSPGPPITIPKPEVVGPGVAVKYQEDDTKLPRWYVIENSEVGQPDSSRNEYPPDHPVSLELLHKKQGERFCLIKDELQSRTAIIKEIVSKYVYRHSDCLEQFETRFPGKNVIRRVILKEQEGKLDLSLMDRLAEQDEQQVKKIEEFYIKELVPVHFVADVRGRSVLAAMYHIVSDTRLRLKCCKGTDQELEVAECAIRETENLVLDTTAVLTLFLLQAHQRLLQIPKELIISEGTLDELRQITSDYDNPESLAGVYVKGGLIPYSTEAVKKAGEDLQELIQLLQSSCKIEPGLIVGELDGQRREKLIRLFGHSGLESMMLAGRAKNALWTDDLATAEVASTDFGCPRVWTQFVVEHFCSENWLEKDFTSQLILRLIQMGYYYTRPNVAILMTAVEETNGDIEKPPLVQALNWFADTNVKLEGLHYVGAVFIKELWQKVQIQSVRQTITIRILELLSTRSSGFRVIDDWAQNIHNVFGLDVVNATMVTQLIEGWRSGGEGSRIIIP